MKKRIFITLSFFTLFIFSFFILDFIFSKKNKKEIVIAAKNKAESQILAEMISILIKKNTDLAVKKKYHLEGSFVCFQAIKAKDIDLYVEFTGTALVSILKEKVIKDPNESYLFVKDEFQRQFNIVWLKPFGFSNNYAMVMLKKKAQELNIEKDSDLKKYPNLIYGFNPEFVSRQEYKIFKKAYGIDFKNQKIMDHILLYFSLANGSIDVIDGFTTDGNIVYYDLEILEDDKQCFPSYDAVPIIREEILEKYPQLEEIINQLAGKISNEDMQKMNFEADYNRKSIEKIALQFLKDKNLIADVL